MTTAEKDEHRQGPQNLQIGSKKSFGDWCLTWTDPATGSVKIFAIPESTYNALLASGMPSEG